MKDGRVRWTRAERASASNAPPAAPAPAAPAPPAAVPAAGESMEACKVCTSSYQSLDDAGADKAVVDVRRKTKDFLTLIAVIVEVVL